MIPFVRAAELWLNNPRAGFRQAAPLKELEQSEHASGSAIEAAQHAKLSHLLLQIRNSNPFFRNYSPLEDAPGYSLRDQLSRYPILTKDMIREDPRALQPAAGVPDSAVPSWTGGTTGAPIQVWRSRPHLAAIQAAYWRGLGWIGIRPLTRGVSAHGFGKASWYGKLRLRLANKISVDHFGADDASRVRAVHRIVRFKPTYVSGYVSDLLGLGEACHEAGAAVKTVVTTGEMLYDHQRRRLADMFQANVHSYYGCNEVGGIAFECEYDTLHISDENVIVEVVDDSGTPIWETPGRILITDLNNRMTPFVRYDVGDVGAISRTRCRCGRALTVLRELRGRQQDALVNSRGERLTTLFFAGRFRNLPLINGVQLVQTSLWQIDLLHSDAEDLAAEPIAEIRKEIQMRLGSEMKICPRRVSQFVTTARGKRQLIVPLKPNAHPD